MKKELLKYLVCPYTKEELELKNAVYDGNKEIKAGILVSKKSKNIYKISNYIPIMLDKKTLKEEKRYSGWAFQWNHKNFEMNKESDIRVEKKTYPIDYRLNKIDFKNKLVLEAGAGGGRVTPILHNENVKEFFAMDISDAIYECRQKRGHLKNIHFIKGDIGKCPFRENSLDIIQNIAVLQHTKSPIKTLDNMASVLKKGGLLMTSHYMTPKNKFTRFKVFYCELIRKFIRYFHVSPHIIMWFSYLSIPTYRIFFLKPIFWAFFHRPPRSTDKIMWQNNFDFYNPNTYQYWVTETEMIRMLLKAGLIPVAETKTLDNGYICEKRL